jgi:hypothetical protein
MIISRRWADALAFGLLLAVAACGGGSGGVETPRPALPTVSREDVPTATRLDVGPEDFLPASGLARWEFDRLNGDGVRLGTATWQAISNGSTSNFRETLGSEGGRTWSLDIGSGGWNLSSLDASSHPNNIWLYVGPILKLPRPFHGVGTTRVVYRSGNYGADVDGDLVNESFEFEFRQTMVGYETVPGPRGPLEALRIREEIRVTVIPSRRSGSSRMVGTITNTWYARGLGVVREETNPLGAGDVRVPEPSKLTLTRFTLDELDPLDDLTIRDVQTLNLLHRELIFDARHGRYYASVPGSVVGQGNRIAVIDPATGAVEFSRVVGSEPGVMAIAADGASLYVVLDGSAELLRLALPGLAELGRAGIATDAAGAFRVESIAASPTEPGVVALSLARLSIIPRHLGLQLVRDLQMQPMRPSSSSKSNRIVFGADGRWLFGLSNETSDFGLQRIEVLSDGLEVRSQLPFAVAVYNVQGMDRTARGLLVGNRLFGEEPLVPQGLINGAQECRATASGRRLVCTDAGLFSPVIELMVADAETATIQNRLRMRGDSTARRLLVPGPTGQVAVRDAVTFAIPNEASRIMLLRHPALP